MITTLSLRKPISVTYTEGYRADHDGWGGQADEDRSDCHGNQVNRIQFMSRAHIWIPIRIVFGVHVSGFLVTGSGGLPSNAG